MDFYQTLVQCTSPTLCTLKPSCLFSLKSNQYKENYEKIISLKKDLIPYGKHIRIIKRKDNLYLIFVYDRKLLESVIYTQVSLLYLESKGYLLNKDIDMMTSQLFSRLKGDISFPHEIGLFLGYPLRDVIAYEKDRGRTSLYTGLWQVYSRVEESCNIMQTYRKCTAYCTKLLMQGMDIPLIIQNYDFREAC